MNPPELWVLSSLLGRGFSRSLWRWLQTDLRLLQQSFLQTHWRSLRGSTMVTMATSVREIRWHNASKKQLFFPWSRKKFVNSLSPSRRFCCWWCSFVCLLAGKVRGKCALKWLEDVEGRNHHILDLFGLVKSSIYIHQHAVLVCAAPCDGKSRSD